MLHRIFRRRQLMANDVICARDHCQLEASLRDAVGRFPKGWPLWIFLALSGCGLGFTLAQRVYGVVIVWGIGTLAQVVIARWFVATTQGRAYLQGRVDQLEELQRKMEDE